MCKYLFFKFLNVGVWLLLTLAAKATLNGPDWGYKSTGAQRAVVLRNLGKIIESKKPQLALLESLDHGKPLREANADLGDALTACETFALLAEEQDRHQNEVVDVGTTDFKTVIMLEPLGVIGAIT